jgi:hypothetical protein
MMMIIGQSCRRRRHRCQNSSSLNLATNYAPSTETCRDRFFCYSIEKNLRLASIDYLYFDLGNDCHCYDLIDR